MHLVYCIKRMEQEYAEREEIATLSPCPRDIINWADRSLNIKSIGNFLVHFSFISELHKTKKMFTECGRCVCWTWNFHRNFIKFNETDFPKSNFLVLTIYRSRYSRFQIWSSGYQMSLVGQNWVKIDTVKGRHEKSHEI